MSHPSAVPMFPRSPLHRPDRNAEDAPRETITVRCRSGDRPIEALVLSKRGDRIQIMLYEGSHSVFCELKPTSDSLAYAGTSLGREIVYERSRAQVEAEIAEGGSTERSSSSW